MKWRIEGSSDGKDWKEIASFFWSELAQAAFDLEYELKKHLWIRLVSPAGKIEERAKTRKK